MMLFSATEPPKLQQPFLPFTFKEFETLICFHGRHIRPFPCICDRAWCARSIQLNSEETLVLAATKRCNHKFPMRGRTRQRRGWKAYIIVWQTLIWFFSKDSMVQSIPIIPQSGRRPCFTLPYWLKKNSPISCPSLFVLERGFDSSFVNA